MSSLHISSLSTKYDSSLPTILFESVSILNCLHSAFAVKQLPVYFLHVTKKCSVKKSSITVPVSDVFC